MLFSAVTTSRKLVLLGVCIFVFAVVFLHATSSGAYWTPSRIAGFTSSADAKRPEEENAGQRPTGVDQGLNNELSGGEAGGRPSAVDHVVPHGGVIATTRVSTPSPKTSHELPTTTTTISHLSSEEIQARIKELRDNWTPPTAAPYHWPPYEWYKDQSYDPNLWESFPWDHDFYISNGVKRLEGAAATPTPYLPYPEYNSDAWKSEWRAEYEPCVGPRGKLLNESNEDIVHAYAGLPPDFPKHAVGNAGVLGVDVEHCFDRFHRYGPYGFGEADGEKLYSYDNPNEIVDWSTVRWDELQDQCMLANQLRFKPSARTPIGGYPDKDLPTDAWQMPHQDESEARSPAFKPRTALLLRTWTNYEYTPNDIENIRALITELNLLSGGEYQVFLLVNVKDNNSRMWKNAKVYQELLNAYVPMEFHGISILWNERMMEQWYPDIGDWQVYWHQFMPLQWFSKKFPEFDFIWNWETDARYTGNHYEFLEQIAKYTKGVPRKHLWERNHRLYFPSAHGSYEQFLNDTDATIEEARAEGTLDVVWGPQPFNATLQQPVGPTPPCTVDEDNFEWGVGEEADLVTLQPIWDPTYTYWPFKDMIFNFLPGVRPHFTPSNPIDKGFTHPDFERIPRRVFINTLSRFSKRQLHAMHVENRAGRTMQAEMWPATVALHHGLKAVYAPHPIWTDRKWPSWYMDAVFNADGGEKARWGARGDSIYNQDREYNFGGWSWYFNSKFPTTLYRRWLGWTSSVGPKERYPNNPLRAVGGKRFENEGIVVQIPDQAPSTVEGNKAGAGGLIHKNKNQKKKKVKAGGMGRMCLPAMLLHPVKHVFKGAEVAPEDDGSYEGASSDWF